MIMEFPVLLICVVSIVTSITISPNGNSPEIKMIGGMMVDVHKDFIPVTTKPNNDDVTNNYLKSRKTKTNSTKLSINERYRRLIPYMTFYYANDIETPTTQAYRSAKSVEIQKAELVEANGSDQANAREPKKIYYLSNKSIPRYQGNRLTQFNIASSNPFKLYKDPHHYTKTPQYYTPISDHHIPSNYVRIPQKEIVKLPSAPFTQNNRKPYYNFFHNDNNSPYIITENEYTPRYKLVPYEQTPPVNVSPLQAQNQEPYEKPKRPIAVPVFIPKEQKFMPSRPVRPQEYYETISETHKPFVKPPTPISEIYYEEYQNPPEVSVNDNGFKPIFPPFPHKVVTVHTSTTKQTPVIHFQTEKPIVPISTTASPESLIPNYYDYGVEEPVEKHKLENNKNLADLLTSLQINKAIPKQITQENVGSSIRTLLQVLNILRAAPHQNEVEPIVLSTPKPFVATTVTELITEHPKTEVLTTPIIDNNGFYEESDLAHVNMPSQHLDETPLNFGSSQRFPPPVLPDDEGGTPGKPGVDYPILTIIPRTKFDCKTQRYKGFFADPETRCQVWHYCDLNGGQASFLCPNGTIFSQAALTCDWWFNVRCSSTAQLYVLNESLYKYILPHSPTFPEDYSGPLVDKYLTLKFKEMEEQFKKNKKKTASDKVDTEVEDSEEKTEKDAKSSSEDKESDNENGEKSDVREASVIVGSPGTSGNVERLQK